MIALPVQPAIHHFMTGALHAIEVFDEERLQPFRAVADLESADRSPAVEEGGADL